jgi:hypothetical protein
MDDLSDGERWLLLDEHSNNKPIPARTELTTSAIALAGLVLDADWNPARHVNIVGWPQEEEQRQSCQQVLLAEQRFFLRQPAS